MSGVTNELIKKSFEISNNFSNSEHDVLVSSGEQVACSLIAGRLIHKGFQSRSWMSWQIPIITKGPYKNSRINQINKNKIIKYLKEGGIPIITGFPGVNNENRITTIGRGGSDASAIMFGFVNISNRSFLDEVFFTISDSNEFSTACLSPMKLDGIFVLIFFGVNNFFVFLRGATEVGGFLLLILLLLLQLLLFFIRFS
jgi:hypothetical protein